MIDAGLTPTRTRPKTHVENESASARRAWADYLAMGPGRSLAKLHATYRERMLYEKTPTTNLARLKAWSASFGWQERINRIEAEENARIERRENIRTEQARIQHRVDMLTLGEKLRARAMAMLNFPLKEEVVQDGGRTIIIKPTKWNASDVPRYADAADKLVRLALDMPTSRRQLDIKSMIIQQAKMQGLSEEETEEAVMKGVQQWEEQMRELGLTGEPTNLIIEPEDQDEMLRLYAPSE